MHIITDLSAKKNASFNMLSNFLDYILSIGAVLKKVSIPYLSNEEQIKIKEQFNYSIILFLDPKILIGILIYLLKSKKESL